MLKPDNKHFRTLVSGKKRNHVDHAVESIKELLHPQAREELLKQRVIEEIREWIEERFRRFDMDISALKLNPWNETHGLGLQSISIEACKNGEHLNKDLLLPGEWKSPTIGVIAPGMVGENATMAMAEFGIDEGKMESVSVLSSGLMMCSSAGGEFPEQNPAIKGVRRLITGPDAVRTYLEMKDASPEKIREDIRNSGVYLCNFLLQK